MTQTVLADQAEATPASAATPENTSTATNVAATVAPEPKAETAPAASKTATEQKPAFELSMPEGALFDSKHLDGIKAFAEANEMSVELAQKLVERDAQIAQSLQAAGEAYRADVVKGWEAELAADKEFGGEKLKASDIAATSVIDRFAPELKAQLIESGDAKNPVWFRLLARVGAAMAEGTRVSGSAPSPRPATKTVQEKFFAASMPVKNAET